MTIDLTLPGSGKSIRDEQKLQCAEIDALCGELQAQAGRYGFTPIFRMITHCWMIERMLFHVQ
jgi:hypothetical protein